MLYFPWTYVLIRSHIRNDGPIKFWYISVSLRHVEYNGHKGTLFWIWTVCVTYLPCQIFFTIIPGVLGGRHGRGRGRLKDYKNTAVAGASFRIRKNVTNKHTENPQTYIEFNYRGHSIAVPMERRVERANISTWSESAENSIKKNIVDPCFHMTKVSALLLSSILGLLWS